MDVLLVAATLGEKTPGEHAQIREYLRAHPYDAVPPPTELKLTHLPLTTQAH